MNRSYNQSNYLLFLPAFLHFHSMQVQICTIRKNTSIEIFLWINLLSIHLTFRTFFPVFYLSTDLESSTQTAWMKKCKDKKKKKKKKKKTIHNELLSKKQFSLYAQHKSYNYKLTCIWQSTQSQEHSWWRCSDSESEVTIITQEIKNMDDLFFKEQKFSYIYSKWNAQASSNTFIQYFLEELSIDTGAHH